MLFFDGFFFTYNLKEKKSLVMLMCLDYAIDFCRSFSVAEASELNDADH